jgi:hypothetical protein
MRKINTEKMRSVVTVDHTIRNWMVGHKFGNKNTGVWNAFFFAMFNIWLDCVITCYKYKCAVVQMAVSTQWPQLSRAGIPRKESEAWRI